MHHLSSSEWEKKYSKASKISALDADLLNSKSLYGTVTEEASETQNKIGKIFCIHCIRISFLKF